jgi:hypothetical protein
MAMIFIGKSECAICGQTLMEGDEIVGLPPISDTSNPLYEYFDAGFHRSCFESWDKKNEVYFILKKEKSNRDTTK